MELIILWSAIKKGTKRRKKDPTTGRLYRPVTSFAFPTVKLLSFISFESRLVLERKESQITGARNYQN